MHSTQIEDFTGRQVGNWFVIGRSEYSGATHWVKKFRMWDVRCSNCGKNSIRTTSEIKTEQVCRNCWLLPKGQAAFNRLYQTYQKVALKNGREFSLTKPEFKELTGGDCHYCYHPPRLCRYPGKSESKAKKKSQWGEYWYNGIDRKNNAVGYRSDNCVPCCFICNRAKGSMGYDEFLDYLKQLVDSHVRSG